MEHSLDKEKSDTEDMKVRQLLQSLGVEFKSLALASDQLQSMVSDLLSDRAAETKDVDYKLQDLDRVTQTLGELSIFVEQISNDVDPDWEVDERKALSLLSLADLASRLGSTNLVRNDNDPYGNASGDCVFL